MLPSPINKITLPRPRSRPAIAAPNVLPAQLVSKGEIDKIYIRLTSSPSDAAPQDLAHENTFMGQRNI